MSELRLEPKAFCLQSLCHLPTKTVRILDKATSTPPGVCMCVSCSVVSDFATLPWVGAGAARGQTLEGQLSTRGQGQGPGRLCRPRGPAEFHGARTNRARAGLFRPRSCTCGIHEGVWCLAPGSSVQGVLLCPPGRRWALGSADRKSTRLNSSHTLASRMPSSA